MRGKEHEGALSGKEFRGNSISRREEKAVSSTHSCRISFAEGKEERNSRYLGEETRAGMQFRNVSEKRM